MIIFFREKYDTIFIFFIPSAAKFKAPFGTSDEIVYVASKHYL